MSSPETPTNVRLTGIIYNAMERQNSLTYEFIDGNKRIEFEYFDQSDPRYYKEFAQVIEDGLIKEIGEEVYARYQDVIEKARERFNFKNIGNFVVDARDRLKDSSNGYAIKPYESSQCVRKSFEIMVSHPGGQEKMESQYDVATSIPLIGKEVVSNDPDKNKQVKVQDFNNDGAFDQAEFTADGVRVLIIGFWKSIYIEQAEGPDKGEFRQCLDKFRDPAKDDPSMFLGLLDTFLVDDESRE